MRPGLAQRARIRALTTPPPAERPGQRGVGCTDVERGVWEVELIQAKAALAHSWDSLPYCLYKQSNLVIQSAAAGCADALARWPVRLTRSFFYLLPPTFASHEPFLFSFPPPFKNFLSPPSPHKPTPVHSTALSTHDITSPRSNVSRCEPPSCVYRLLARHPSSPTTFHHGWKEASLLGIVLP
jgi:hypothetical protein